MKSYTSKRFKKREFKSDQEEINYLKSQLLVARIFGLMMTILCVFFAVKFMSNNNLLAVANINNVLEFEACRQELETENGNLKTYYSTLENEYDSFLQTIDELTSISVQLDEQNKLLTQVNQEQLEELEIFRQREELYDKHEYALFDSSGERTDIRYDQIVSLEELLEESYIDDEDLILAWIMTESNGVEKARNPESTAKGFGQILDGTSEFIYVDLMDNSKSDWNSGLALDGDTNIEMMVTYIDYLYEVNNGNLYEVIRDYRGKQDISGYVGKIDYYLANANKSVNEIYLAMK